MISIDELERLERLIKECPLCHVGMTRQDGTAYVLPMNFGYEAGVIYLHSGHEGELVDILNRDPRVCITFCTPPSLLWQNEDVACSYGMRADSAICRGKVQFEEDIEEKVRGMNVIMRHYTERDFNYSTPAINGVKIWKIPLEEVSIREFGVPSKNAVRFRASRVL